MNQEGTVSETFVLSEEEAFEILNNDTSPPIPPNVIQKPGEIDYGDAYRKNQNIIEACDALILERIEAKDDSVKISEVNSTRAEAFKQNQLIKGGATENVNFNLKTIQDMNPDQLFELLGQLND